MKKLFFDIETLPAHQDKHELLRQVFERKQAKAQARGKEMKNDFESFVSNTTFDGAYGRIFCISYAIDDAPIQSLQASEQEILNKFWKIARECDLFIGHNILDFDLRFIMQRSIINGIKPSKELSFARYRKEPIYDIMYEWTRWNAYDKISLENLALALDIRSPKDGIDGSRVYEFYQAGRYEEICRYCNADVETVRAIYRRMTFQDPPNLGLLPFDAAARSRCG